MSNTEAIADLGQAIRAQRKALQMSQEELALLADCGVVFLRQLEKGKETARLSKVLDVLEALGLVLRLEPASAKHSTPLHVPLEHFERKQPPLDAPSRDSSDAL